MIRNRALPFLGECYADEARPFSSQDVCNWLPAPAEKSGTLTPEMAQTPPGLAPFVEIPGESTEAGYIPSKPVRGTYNCEGKLFSVIGNTLYQITNKGVAIPLGSVPGVLRTRFAHNQVTGGNQLVTVNGTSGYVYDTPTQIFEKITDEGYPGAITADFVDGYIVGIEPGRRFAFNSDLANAREYNTLDRFTSEYKPDLLVTQVVSNNELILLSETSGEVFYNSGASQQPFRTKRVFFDKGCSGRCNAAVIDNSFVFHSSDGMFYLYEGGVPKRISTRPIEQAVAGLNWSQGFAEVWIDGGHSVVYWTFPGGHTWGWDASSGKWHRRASYGMDRWRMNTLTKWTKSAAGKRDEWIAGDFQAGRLWRVDWDYLLEGDQEFVSEIVGVVLSDSQNPLTMPRLEVMLDTGQELTVAREFPAQPEPPAISGALPDGTTGISWAGGTYTATGGAPPYKFTSRPGTSFPGNLGPMNSAGVVAAETPDATGLGVNIARVTDSNGLFAEMTDNFVIGNAIAVLGSSNVTNRPFVLFGAGGTDWDNAYQYGALPVLESVGLLGGDGHWVNWNLGAGSPQYSTDETATAWITSAATFDAPSKTSKGCYEATSKSFLIPSNGGIHRSSDYCQNVAKVTTIPAYAIDASPTLALSVSQFGTSPATAPSPFTTWALTGAAHGLVLSSGSSVKYGGGRFLIGAGDGSLPKAVFTSDGTAYTAIALPTLSAGYISAAAYNPDAGRWVAGTNAGELLYMDESDGIWHLAATPLASTDGVKGMEYNGAVFVCIGNNVVATTVGKILYGDGSSWAVATTAESVSTQALAVMK